MHNRQGFPSPRLVVPQLLLLLLQKALLLLLLPMAASAALPQLPSALTLAREQGQYLESGTWIRWQSSWSPPPASAPTQATA